MKLLKIGTGILLALSICAQVPFTAGAVNQPAPAEKFVPRLTQPSRQSDSWYKPSNNPFPFSTGNCTWYTWGRVWEMTGKQLPYEKMLRNTPSTVGKPVGGISFRNNARNWWWDNIELVESARGGYPYGTEPRPGAMCVWGKSDPNASDAGHVAVVEKVEGNKVTYSESGWASYYWKLTTRDKSNMGTSGGGGPFLGYIYFFDEGNTAITPDKPALQIENPVVYAAEKFKLHWQPVNAATGYSVQIKDAQGTVVTQTDPSSATSYTASLPAGSYSATVTAHNSDHGTNSVSEAVGFTVVENELPIPGKPLLQLQGDAQSQSTAQSVRFNWTATPNTDAYHLRIYSGEELVSEQAGITTFYAGVYLSQPGEYRAVLSATMEGSPIEVPSESIAFTVRKQSFEPWVSGAMGEKKYLVFRNDLNWEDAKAVCEALGGTLATIRTPQEQAFVEGLLNTSGENSPFISYFLGATDRETEGEWKWVDGEKLDYTNWNIGQPDNASQSENYLSLRQEFDWKWNDLPAFYRDPYGFILEAPATVSLTFDTGTQSELPSLAVEYGTVPTMPQPPARAGFQFAGWYTDTGLSIPFDAARPVLHSRTLYAKWMPTLRGDANGDGKITSFDALVILNHVAGIQEVTGDKFLFADTNGDGKIASFDALQVLNIVAGVI